MGIRQTLVLAVASWASAARAAPPASPSQSNCAAAPVELDALVDATRRGEEAFAQMNLDGLERAHEAAVGVVPCLTERVSRVAAADFHRLVALKGFTEEDVLKLTADDANETATEMLLREVQQPHRAFCSSQGQRHIFDE